MTQISGVLASLSVYNQKWGRGSMRLDDGRRLTCVGEALATLAAGNRYRFEGQLLDHPRYGRQIAVASAAIDLPASGDALVAHLVANYRGCGEATAKKLVAHYGERLDDLREILIERPAALDFSVVTRRRVKALDTQDTASLILRELSGRIGSAGIGAAVLRRLAEWLLPAAGDAEPVRQAWQRFAADPYAPLRQVDGYAFPVADRIALDCLGLPRDFRPRLAALAAFALSDGCERNGHSFLDDATLAQRIVAWDAQVDAREAIDAALESGTPLVREDGRCYPRHLYHAEVMLARHLARRALAIATPISTLAPIELDAEIASAEAGMGTGFALDAEQRAAILGVLSSTHTLHTITAGPGCGKTALMEVLAHVARERTILFCAPTGKAAKVLAARVARHGRTASTLHSLLGVVDALAADKPRHLVADIVVVDESSMLDLSLARTLFDALPSGCHLILLGDTGQLPSVGPGDVLQCLLKLPGDHHQLHRAHRNDGGILELVRQARDGDIACRDLPGVRFLRGLPAPDEAGLAPVVDAYLDAAARCGLERIALLMPRRKGDPGAPGWNTTYLNEALRQRLNPHGQRIPGTPLRIGDRVLIRRNLMLDAEDGGEPGSVVNGDTGRIEAHACDAQGRNVLYLELLLDDGRRIRFPGGALEALALAYALTVHAAQGSEYREVIVVMTGGSPAFVHRAMLTTAFSRARDRLTVLGDAALIHAVCARPAPPRHAQLIERTLASLRKMTAAGYR
jgi:exodeoxyribonuclease V alpha subunit